MPFWLSLWHFNFSSKKKKNYVQDHSMFILFSKFFSRYSKAQSSRENKKKWNKWTVFWSIKFSSSSYSNLSSSVVVGRLNNLASLPLRPGRRKEHARTGTENTQRKPPCVFRDL